MNTALFPITKPTTPDEYIAKSSYEYIFLKDLFVRAQKASASDIHIATTDNEISVRFRVNGDLVNAKYCEEDCNLIQSIVSSTKQISHIRTTNIHVPESSSFSLEETKSQYRVEYCPTYTGHNFYFRIAKQKDILVLDKLGFSEDFNTSLRRATAAHRGIILVTGPTGQGKSTTIHAALREIDSDRRNILTIENPVERTVRNYAQIHITPQLTWEEAIKSSLRSDPDVIFIGEIRSAESAEMAFQAARTGHLVFSTLHADSVPGIISRLKHYQISLKDIHDLLLFASNQRLVQMLCPKCKKIKEPGGCSIGDGCEYCTDVSGIPGIINRRVVYEYVGDLIQKRPYTEESLSLELEQSSISNKVRKLVSEGHIEPNSNLAREVI